MKQHNPNTILEKMTPLCDAPLTVTSFLDSTPRRFFDRRKRLQISAPLCEYARLEPGIEVWIELKRYWINIWSSQHRQAFETQKSTKEQELWKIIIDILRMRFPF